MIARGSLAAMKSDPDTKRVREYLSSSLGLPVRLTITDNRHSLITCQTKNGVAVIRLHHMFLHADRRFLRSLASFCKRPTKSNRQVINRYIAEHNYLIAEKDKAKPPPKPQVRGEQFDLQELFDKINAKYFKRTCDAVITWGRDTNRRRRRSIQLGSYDFEANAIRIHPTLDAPWVPRYVLEALVYHEILHWLFRPRQNGSRRVFHGRAFREAETAFPHYERTQKWIEKNLPRLLKR